MSAPRTAVSRMPSRSFSAPRMTARTITRPATVNRSFATRSVASRNIRTPTRRNNALNRSFAVHRNTNVNRSFTANRLNRTNIASGRFTNNRLANGRLNNNRQLARVNTTPNRFSSTRTGAPNASRALVNAGNPRRNLASNQFAFRSGNFQRGWIPGRTYSWQGHRWGCYGGVWCEVGIGWPYDWYSYPYPFYYDGLVYYDGDVYQPGGAAVSGNMVADVQSTLDNAGYNAGPADGIDGPQTQNAIAQYQADNGLQSTGAIDEPTLQSLGLQ